MLGLIGAALAGGAQGAGEAGQRALASMQEAQQKEDLTRLSNELDEQKQLRIEGARQSFQTGERKATQEYTTSERMGAQAFTAEQEELRRQNAALLAAQRIMAQAGENDKNRTHQTALQNDRFNFERDEHALDRQSREREGAASRATQIAAANIAAAPKPQLVQQGDGTYTIVNIAGDGSAKAIMGPDGKPLKGAKDLSAGTIQYINFKTQQMRDEFDPAKRAQIAAEVEAVYSGRMGAPGAQGSGQPPAGPWSRFGATGQQGQSEPQPPKPPAPGMVNGQREPSTPSARQQAMYEAWFTAKQRRDQLLAEAQRMSPDRREAYLSARLPDVEAQIKANENYTQVR